MKEIIVERVELSDRILKVLEGKGYKIISREQKFKMMEEERKEKEKEENRIKNREIMKRLHIEKRKERGPYKTEILREILQKDFYSMEDCIEKTGLAKNSVIMFLKVHLPKEGFEVIEIEGRFKIILKRKKEELIKDQIRDRSIHGGR